MSLRGYYWRRERILPSEGTLVLVTRGGPAVSLADARDYLRVDEGIEDAVIENAVLAVQGMLEPPEGWLGRSLSQSEYRLDLPRFADEIVVPAPPLVSVDAINYLSTDGTTKAVDAADYSVTEGDPASIVINRDKRWPTDVDCTRPDAVQIEFTAGYSDGDCPQVIQQWIKYQVAQFYDIRQPIIVGTSASETPFVRNMLETWRVRL